MIDSSFETFPIEDLKRLVEHGGGFLREDRRRTKALLKDEFPEHPLQIHVLSTALDTDVPSSLRSATHGHALVVEAGRLSDILMAQYGLQEYVARWAVAAWGFAVGIWPLQAVSSSLVVGGGEHWPPSLERAEEQPRGAFDGWARSAAVTVGPEATHGTVTSEPSGSTPEVRSDAESDAALATAAGGAAARAPAQTADNNQAQQRSQPKAERKPKRAIWWLLPAGVVLVAIAAGGAYAATHMGGGGVRPIWTASAGAPNSSPVFASGLVVLGSGTSLNAYSVTDGIKAWSATDPDGRSPFLSSDGRTLYVANDRQMYSINGSDGSANWTATLKAKGLRSVSPTPPTIGSGLVFVAANNNTRVYGVSSSTGTYENYIYSPKGTSMYFQPAASQGLMLIPEHISGGIWVSAWKAGSPAQFHGVGKDNWFVQTGSDKPLLQPVVSGGPGAVYSMNTGLNTLYSLRPADGGAIWHLKVGTGPATPIAASGSSLYLGSGHTLFALRATDGSTMWSFKAGGEIVDQPVISHGVVYFGANDHSVYALRASTGKKLWSYTTGGPIEVSPLVSNGKLIAAAGNGKLYAFSVSK